MMRYSFPLPKFGFKNPVPCHISGFEFHFTNDGESFRDGGSLVDDPHSFARQLIQDIADISGCPILFSQTNVQIKEREGNIIVHLRSMQDLSRIQAALDCTQHPNEEVERRLVEAATSASSDATITARMRAQLSLLPVFTGGSTPVGLPHDQASVVADSHRGMVTNLKKKRVIRIDPLEKSSLAEGRHQPKVVQDCPLRGDQHPPRCMDFNKATSMYENFATCSSCGKVWRLIKPTPQ